MFAGPIIAREVKTSPRPARFYVGRASYAGLLFILMWTAWQALIGWREDIGIDLLSKFGGLLVLIFSMTQLALMLFIAPLSAASAVAHEKDRRTFLLLLMTDLSDLEIVLGKLAASLIQIFALLAAAAPVFALILLMGGVGYSQVAQIVLVTASAGVAGGSLGLLVALWRDRTFQSLALTVLLIVLTLALVEVAGAAAPGASIGSVPIRSALNPFRAIGSILAAGGLGGSVIPTTLVFVSASMALSAAFLGFGVWMLRVWNPGRNEPREQREGEEEAVVEALIEVAEEPAEVLVGVGAVEHGRSSRADDLRAGGRGAGPRRSGGTGPVGDEPGATTGLHVPRRTHRRVGHVARPYRRPWANPILWREFATRAYGAKPLIIKGAYILAFALGVGLYATISAGVEEPIHGGLSIIPIALAVLSLILINTQGVTALTSERDTGALDLLLVTELSPKEFIYGKLYGVFYNAREMIALPLLLTCWLGFRGDLTGEDVVFVVVDFLILAHFAAMLGLHAAITYTNSRAAVAHSLGTIFFLMVGIGICAFLIVLGNREFGRQLASFLIFIGVGSVGLYNSLGSRNPSQAIALVALLTPFCSFYCIISLLNGDTMAAFLVACGVYGFALLSMLVPAVSDFDIALGRTNAIQG